MDSPHSPGGDLRGSATGGSSDETAIDPNLTLSTPSTVVAEEEEASGPFSLTPMQQRRLAMLRAPETLQTRHLSLQMPPRQSTPGFPDYSPLRSRPTTPHRPIVAHTAPPHFAQGLVTLLHPVMMDLAGQATAARTSQSALDAEIIEMKERISAFAESGQLHSGIKSGVAKVETLRSRLALVNIALERACERMERCRVILEAQSPSVNPAIAQATTIVPS